MIDFVHDILFGIDYPGLVKALDPVTLGLLVGQGIQQFGKMREAKQQEEAAQTQMTQGQDLYDKMVSEFESGKYDVSLSQDVRDTAEQQRILAEQVTDAATERAVQAQQSALAAARYGDARSAALIPSQVRQLEAGVQQAEIQGLQQKVASDAALASAQQRVDEQNKQLQQSLGAMKLKRGAAGIDAGQLAAQQARAAGAAAKSALFATIGQGLTAGLAGRSGDGGDDNSTSEVNSLLRRLETNPSNTLDATLRAQLSDPLFENEEEDIPLDFNIGDVFQQRARQQGVDTFQGSGKKGMQYEFADKGGEVHMTEGEFSHKTNKKALIDEETGVKEAELTGNEAMVRDGENVLVFNPNQQSTIESLVNKGDSKGLMKKMKALLKKFNKQNV
tara:strand:+ start:2324 stop:3493 length:1170 start_codon:yes stop_codon:yes gene_type:complete